MIHGVVAVCAPYSSANDRTIRGKRPIYLNCHNTTHPIPCETTLCPPGRTNCARNARNNVLSVTVEATEYVQTGVDNRKQTPRTA